MQKSNSNAHYEQLIREWEELKKLDFPESPGHPFLDNLYVELAEYAVYVSKTAGSILEKGEKPEKITIPVDEEWNTRLDSFSSDEKGANQVCFELRQYKQALDDFITRLLSSPE
jgi:hypothetical protein